MARYTMITKNEAQQLGILDILISKFDTLGDDIVVHNRRSQDAAQQIIDKARAPKPPTKRELIAAGQTIFIKQDRWTIAGPTADVTEGAIVTVTKRDGSTTRVRAHNVAPFDQDGIQFAMADFKQVPDMSAPAYPTRHVDRQAATVAGFLGVAQPDTHGGCHYCGLPLDRRGRCAECV